MWAEARLWLARHRGKFWGSLIGLALSLMIMRFGLVWTVFITGAVLVGYLVGKHLDDEQENLTEVLERLLPPGRR